MHAKVSQSIMQMYDFLTNEYMTCKLTRCISVPTLTTPYHNPLYAAGVSDQKDQIAIMTNENFMIQFFEMIQGSEL